MATAVIMPKSGQSVESCILTEWHKRLGESVQEGELLFSYETDKASFEEKAKASGVLLAQFFQADEDVPCLVNVAVIGEEGEDISGFAPEGGAQPAAESSTAATASAATASAATASAASAPAPTVTALAQDGPVAASPRARATAARIGVPIAAALPTGPQGRIIERDVLAVPRIDRPIAGAEMVGADIVAAAVMDEDAYHDEKLTNIRKVIARSMQESLSNSAQLTNHIAFDASALLALRKELKAAAERAGLPNITLNDMLLFACSRVLLKHPDLNAHFLGDSIRTFRHAHIGIAVDTPRGLMVPTLFNADQCSLKEIANQSKALAAAAQSGSINPDLLTGATFTISNLGTMGTEFFTPILNPPQVGILGIGCTVERVRTRNGVVETFPAMGLSLTYDHRAVDGAPAARFLQTLKQELECFTLLLVQ